MARINCWEYKKCGREPGGKNVAELGICPAVTEVRTKCINNGINGGRGCWVIAGTFYKGEVQGTYAMKIKNCMECDLYRLVREEEGADYKDSIFILGLLK